jgi:alpha-N-arabinofuranosidase
MKKIFQIISGMFFSVSVIAQAPPKVDIDATKPLVPIQPTMYGVFFEDINFGADGGLYAELIKNRSFEFEYPWMGWKHLPDAETRFNTQNELTIYNNSKVSPNNPKIVRVEKRDQNKDIGLQNEGFDGIGFKKDAKYDFSAFVRSNKGNITLEVQLLNEKGSVIGATALTPNTINWGKVEAVVTATESVQNGKFNILFKGNGQLDIDIISLFPQDTWKGRKGGLRKDLVQLLADMKPGFVRFPGGCIVEGRTLAERYQWKKTVGKVENRELLINRWNKEFSHRPAPDYYQTFGLGFFEYFQMCEDIGASPVPILSCGLACQFNSSEMQPIEDLDPFVQDALDLIEFANGPVTTKWGALRAEMGHPESFNLKMIGIGNEQWGEEYFERYDIISKAIRARYPEVKIISGTGPSAEGELFEAAEKVLSTYLKADIVDEHYYKEPKWFLENATRYDNYDRNRYKIFAGEYAAQSKAVASPENINNWKCALAEAAYLTGLERNADVVFMTSYAPLFAHVNKWQWTPDLIWFDNLTSFGTPSYYVQKLYANNPGTKTLPIKVGGENLAGKNGVYANASWDENTNEVIIKIVNTSEKENTYELNIKGLPKKTSGKLWTLKANDLSDFNSLVKPQNVAPIEYQIVMEKGRYNASLEANSFYVFRIRK